MLMYCEENSSGNFCVSILLCMCGKVIWNDSDLLNSVKNKKNSMQEMRFKQVAPSFILQTPMF